MPFSVARKRTCASDLVAYFLQEAIRAVLGTRTQTHKAWRHPRASGGANLPYGFSTFDDFRNGVATSIKSIDLALPSYTKSGGILSQIKKYINSAANFESYTKSGFTLTAADITERVVQVAIRPGSATIDQWLEISKAFKYAKDNSVRLTIKVIN